MPSVGDAVSLYDLIHDLVFLLPPMPIRLDVHECIIGIGLIGWTNLEINLWKRFR